MIIRHDTRMARVIINSMNKYDAQQDKSQQTGNVT